MLQRFVDDLKASAGSAVRQTSLAAMAAISLFITTAFLCGAAFVAVLNRYGPIYACLAGAAIFFVVTLIAAGIYLVRKRRFEARAAARASGVLDAGHEDPERTVRVEFAVCAAVVGGGGAGRRQRSEIREQGSGIRGFILFQFALWTVRYSVTSKSHSNSLVSAPLEP